MFASRKIDDATYRSEDVRLAWCDWFRQHDIDPGNVTDGWVEVDTDLKRIWYEAYDLNDRGSRYACPCGKRGSTSVHMVQLDDSPAPFPGEVELAHSERFCHDVD